MMYFLAFRCGLNCKNFEIRKLKLTTDAGDLTEPEAKTKCYGVYIVANQRGEFSNIQIENLNIHHIFATEKVKGDGNNPTSNMAMEFILE